MAYQQEVEQVLLQLGSQVSGLRDEEAKARLAQQGPNQLKGKKKVTAVVLFFRQFLNPLVYVLVAAASIKAIVKGPVDAMTIFAVLLFMAIVGFIQEFRAGKAMDALLQLSAPKAKVRRQGVVRVIPAEQIVAGDVVILEAGDKIPADGRLIEAASLKINESSLTGESLSIEKHTRALPQDLVLGERKNMVYTATAVVSGRGQMVVVSTGMQTEIGRIASAVGDIKEEKTSLQRSIDQLGKSLIWIVLSTCAVLIMLGLFREMTMLDVFMLAVAAAVAAVPEGLPAVVTVSLATGMQRMARHHAIIRKLMAVETLGSTTVICSDKTGTLTLNQMTVKEIYVNGSFVQVSGDGYVPEGQFTLDAKPLVIDQDRSLMTALRAGLLCNDAGMVTKKGAYDIVGDPTEGALVVLAAKAGLDKKAQEELYPRLNEIPFESERQYMATVHRYDGKQQVFVKGSLERLLPKAGYYMHEGVVKDMDDAFRSRLSQAADSMASKAMRVIVLAYAPYAGDASLFKEDDINGRLVIVALTGLIDPPREEAKRAIAVCHEGGIKVVMATGDNLVTGRAVAAKLGIQGSLTVTGQQLKAMSDKELDEKIEQVSVFARIEPLHKLRIIQAFKRKGHVVAMTGDGVNDAPALEAADIGVAMGITGTDVAKESADMVLANDNFATIVTAVEEGRAIFNRLRHVIFFLMTTCFGELLVLILAISFVGESPLTPLQILWINLVTGGLLAIPLGLEPKVGDELKQPPRSPKVGLIFKGMILRIALLSTMLGIGAVLVFAWSIRHFDLNEARTMTFCTIVVFEWLIALNARSDEHTVFRLGIFKNPALLMTLAVAIVLQLLVVYTPFAHRFFETVPLKGFEWGIVLLPGLFIFTFESLRKKLAPKLFSDGKWS